MKGLFDSDCRRGHDIFTGSMMHMLTKWLISGSEQSDIQMQRVSVVDLQLLLAVTSPESEPSQQHTAMKGPSHPPSHLRDFFQQHIILREVSKQTWAQCPS